MRKKYIELKYTIDNIYKMLHNNIENTTRISYIGDAHCQILAEGIFSFIDI